MLSKRDLDLIQAIADYAHTMAQLQELDARLADLQHQVNNRERIEQTHGRQWEADIACRIQAIENNLPARDWEGQQSLAAVRRAMAEESPF